MTVDNTITPLPLKQYVLTDDWLIVISDMVIDLSEKYEAVCSENLLLRLAAANMARYVRLMPPELQKDLAATLKKLQIAM
jgi:hypothetical protein